ncbi:N-acetylmuramic acid 6-phosphate etherase [Fretibacter rubidus]|uniref:N-acetylmuramic acid 6-phosphate etherase n=1 Tax=Fretibacter rubidus TaxID=570162 RepID=UPI00352B26FF
MTEEIIGQYSGLDTWPTRDIVKAMYDGQVKAVQAVEPSIDAIADAVDMAANRLGKAGRLIYIGAGTSGRLAVQDGSELGPTFNWPHTRIVYGMAGGMDALVTSQEGAEDNIEAGHVFIRSIDTAPEDIVFCVAASGQTPYTLGALREARSRGAVTIGIVNNANTAIFNEADHGILAETGGEIIAGSTRMKAGTAQKAVLNMLSTAIMTRLGRVYDGLMVDMIVSNAKLENRAINMVAQIAACSTDTAKAALAETNNHIKQAVLVSLGASHIQSKGILIQANDNLRAAIGIFENQ